MIPRKPIVLDTCVLIQIAKVGLLEKLGNGSLNICVLDLVAYDEFEFKDGTDLESLGYDILTVSEEMIDTLSKTTLGLTYFDALLFNYCKNKPVVFLTADKVLYNKAKKEGIVVYRTLILIDWMLEDKIIDVANAVNALKIWKHDPDVYIPDSAIDAYLNKLS